MTPSHRTPQQRDRRFARIRRLTQAIFLSSGVVSAVLVGYVASAAKPAVTVPVTVPATTVPTTTVASHTSVATTPTTVYTPPVTAPVTHTTVCYSTPSGTVVCH
jgi:phosphoribosylcarboxyaminoimidazole (NCAIR) mutase